ncbi:hypothetical protein GIB67_031810 [Kingdonia uniflora]|uniref:Uncharacterized protein n=1 Tax=Kingdonia uniflora TaxID=39325 RepID=A0A7J7L4G5_9MAGN|nr:hypothetical protein GIB67_031810 [Kingdonia uniflora]
MYKNIKKYHRGTHLEKLVWGAAKAWKQTEKKEFLDQLKLNDPATYDRVEGTIDKCFVAISGSGQKWKVNLEKLECQHREGQIIGSHANKDSFFYFIDIVRRGNSARSGRGRENSNTESGTAVNFGRGNGRNMGRATTSTRGKCIADKTGKSAITNTERGTTSNNGRGNGTNIGRGSEQL